MTLAGYGIGESALEGLPKETFWRPGRICKLIGLPWNDIGEGVLLISSKRLIERFYLPDGGVHVPH